MNTFISIFIYLIFLVGLSTILYFTLTAIWSTNEPVIAFTLTLIFAHLLLSYLGDIKKQ